MNYSTFIKHTLFTVATATMSYSAMALDQVTFQLDWLPGGDKAPVYVGIEEGFFAEQGIEVSIKSGRGSTEAITKIATGNADVGIADITALLLAKANDNVPVTGIYSQFSIAPHTFVFPADSGIKSVKDVEGKKIPTSPFTSSNLFLPLLLEVNGVAEDSVTLTKVDPGALGPMLITGATDVVISWVTSVENYKAQAAEAGMELSILPWDDAGLEFYSTSVIAADKFLAERPDVAKRFVTAYAKSIEFTWANPTKAAEAVHKAVVEVDVKTAVDTINAIKGLVYNQVSAKDGIGAFNAERLATTWKWTAKAQGVDEASFDPETAISRLYQ